MPAARKTSACSPRSSVRPQTSQDTTGMLVLMDLRVTSTPAYPVARRRRRPLAAQSPVKR
jgi:hypothetical protein